jgi:hypothetical protein
LFGSYDDLVGPRVQIPQGGTSAVNFDPNSHSIFLFSLFPVREEIHISENLPLLGDPFCEFLHNISRTARRPKIPTENLHLTASANQTFLRPSSCTSKDTFAFSGL